MYWKSRPLFVIVSSGRRTSVVVVPEFALTGLKESAPLGTTLEPEDLAGTAVYLASDASRFVTGQTIMVDGGTVML